MTSEAIATPIAVATVAVGALVLLRRLARRSNTQVHRVVVPARGER